MNYSISVEIEPDTDGLTGRECPNSECEGYFKVQFGTGITTPDAPCHCPYCGRCESADNFWTKEQLDYARSVAMREISELFYRKLKKYEFRHRPSGAFGIGMSLKVERGRRIPIHKYREKQLETEAVCESCTLRYAVYGVFAYCPDCGQHNSLQILNKNLELALKMIELAASADSQVSQHLIANALQDCVSAFDGFGREQCRLHAAKSTHPTKAEKISFQNLEGARENLQSIFDVDFSSGLASADWQVAVREFQKRHLVSHKMGIVDEEYLRKTSDAKAIVGRKVSIEPQQVRELTKIIAWLGNNLATKLR